MAIALNHTIVPARDARASAAWLCDILGRGLYWNDPNGQYLEIITRPYGSGE
jgi:hypothetical protein